MGRRKIRVNSSITRLPPAVQEQIDLMLGDIQVTYKDIEDWLQNQGYNISHSAIGRYAIRRAEETKRISEMMVKSKAIAETVAHNPDVDYGKASRILALDALTQRLLTMSPEEMDALPPDKAGRLIAQLASVELREQKILRDYKSKTDKALDAMEAQLMEAIKHDPELAPKLHEVLTQARERLSDD